MGCDIHMFVEYKRSKGVRGTVEGKKVHNEQWVNGDNFRKIPFYDPEYDSSEFEVVELDGNRDYALFATIAGVRMYTDECIPVSEPKGLPHDVCEFVKKESDEYGDDGHSHSWLTLKELRDYQALNPKFKYSGLLDEQQRHNLDHGIQPDHWCQGTNQPGYKRRDWEVDNDSLKRLIERMQQRAHELMQCEWEVYDTALDEKIRIVFWFDN